MLLSERLKRASCSIAGCWLHKLNRHCGCCPDVAPVHLETGDYVSLSLSNRSLSNRTKSNRVKRVYRQCSKGVCGGNHLYQQYVCCAVTELKDIVNVQKDLVRATLFFDTIIAVQVSYVCVEDITAIVVHKI
ncbi:Hypothetical predicted protein [Octopus vulgaris]|uniref:Uncharacterized protein n=1 Tax=Octopus vulgaris TaxID=6645 RepID=A0AA36FII9_OCTVU|nr:Hypothetical predicted protein [Octopus vulgaris]